MKVVTGEIMQEIDRRAIKGLGISSLSLMENAGRGCAEVISARYGSFRGARVTVMAGKGNNGGDGYVIARFLHEWGWQVKTLVLGEPGNVSGDARVNLERLDPDAVVFCADQEELDRFLPELHESDVVVDALLGTGLKNEVRGMYLDAITAINRAGKPVVAVDIPSGIDAGSGKILGRAVQADMTVTFALAKVGHILYPGAVHTGKLHVVDIGIPETLLAEADGFEFLDDAAIHALLRRRKNDAHKGNFGHCMIVAGSTGKTGAAAMAANSAVRTGAGLVTLAVPSTLNAILEVKTTEPMTLPLPDTGQGHIAEDAAKFISVALAGKSALALGPGLSRHPETSRVVRELVERVELPMVVDADGLNALSEDLTVLLKKTSANVVLTPHPGEMARLCGSLTPGDVENDRIGKARGFATRYQVTLVLKGARTVIAFPDGRIAINGSGNPGMASGGMGDVLTGILVSLLSQGYDTFSACKMGVYIHGKAADLVAAERGEIGISATDVQEHIPRAIQQLIASNETVMHKEVKSC